MTNIQLIVHGGAVWVAKHCCEAAPIYLVQNKKADWILNYFYLPLLANLSHYTICF